MKCQERMKSAQRSNDQKPQILKKVKEIVKSDRKGFVHSWNKKSNVEVKIGKYTSAHYYNSKTAEET